MFLYEEKYFSVLYFGQYFDTSTSFILQYFVCLEFLINSHNWET